MNSTITRAFTVLIICIPQLVFGQTTLNYFEDFEATNTSFIHLNSTDVGANNGPNQWVINNDYTGQPVYANTVSQTQTFGGAITHPDSNYLHIYDSNQPSASNANFDPSSSSDRFTTIGPFCTLGQSNVHFAFYYLCKGNVNSYGQVYYKAGNGPWTPATGTNYSNTLKWKYEDITDVAYENVDGLQFGFRWTNGFSTDTASSFAIDDIRIVSSYDPVKYPVRFSIPMLVDTPVCANSDMLFEMVQSGRLCGMGNYIVQLSAPGGSFTNAVNPGGIYILSNSDSVNFLNVHIPSNTVAGLCYRIRVIRIDVSPNIISDSSACFEVKSCSNTITTLQPSVLKIPNDTICTNSVIDVPFLSTGVFDPNSSYRIELSDENGTFSGAPNILGTLYSHETLPGPPGTVSGIIATYTPVPGCYYYVRVVSTSPHIVGSTYGPFCIRNCDITTNNLGDLQACVTSTTGFDGVIDVDINSHDFSAIYDANDTFKIQVIKKSNFTVLNTGGLGYLTHATADAALPLHIPGTNGLAALGLGKGEYYLRVVATGSNQPWNLKGSLIRLNIGAPSDSLNVLYMDPNTFITDDFKDTSVCIGSTVFVTVDPDNFINSTYKWSLNNNDDWDPGHADYSGAILNQTGDFYFSVIETNFGCQGPPSDTIHFKVKGAPSVVITAPAQACVGDTVSCSVPLENQTYYTWSTIGGAILDTSNNLATIAFPSSGIQQVKIHALSVCGSANGTKNITVKDYPVIDAGNDTAVCRHSGVQLSAGVGSYTYLWSTGETTEWIVVAPDSTTTYTITTKPVASAACASYDTVVVTIKPTPEAHFDIAADPNQLHHYIAINNSIVGPNDWYQWSWGDGHFDFDPYPSHTYADTGFYDICLTATNPDGCGSTYCDETFHALRTSNTMVYVNVVPVGTLEQEQAQQLSIYPNPVADNLYINNGSMLNGALTISNILGEVVYTNVVSGKQETVNCKPFPSGVYFVQIKSESGSVVKRFVKE